MRDWHTELDALGNIPLGADWRLSRMSLPGDHIWTLTSLNVQPPALTFLTRFGLQARSFQIFPTFAKNDTAVHHPQDFTSPPLIHFIFTNFLQASFAPWDDLLTTAAYWVPEGQSVGGTFTFTNTGTEPLQFRFQLAGVLHPLKGGRTMKAEVLEGRTILRGETGALHPLLFLTGGAGEGTGPFPSLSLEIDLPPNQSKSIQWVSAAMEHTEDSFQVVQSIMERNWEAEFARIETLCRGQLHISTGDPLWDLAFSLSQRIGFGSICHQAPEKGSLHFQDGRLDLDHPHPTGPGFEHPFGDIGITALQAFYLANLLSPTPPEMLESLVGSFLESAREDGFVPFCNHPGKEERDLLSSPFFVRLVWKAYEMNRDLSYLEDLYPTLVKYLEAWFRADQDRDGDGAPEWSRVRQVECSAHPAHPSCDDWHLVPHIHYLESPALCALLTAEIDCLLDICELLNETGDVQKLQKRKQALSKHIQRSWDAEEAQYRRWDRESHRSPSGKSLQSRSGPGLMIVKKKLDFPSRLVIHIKSDHPLSPKTRIFLHGVGESKAHWVESISIHQIHWNGDRGNATSQHLYSYLEYVVSYGISQDVEISVEIGDFQSEDILLLLPLGSKTAAQDQASALIERKITVEGAFRSAYGLCSGIKPDNPSILLPWNSLIGEGLLAYGKQHLAVDLCERLMRLIIKNIRKSKSFFTAYDSTNGNGRGRPYRITGAAPIGLFLRTLGIQIHSNRELLIKWENPFPWPVKLLYRGLEVIHEKGRTTVIFPDGQRTVVRDQDRKVVRLG